MFSGPTSGDSLPGASGPLPVGAALGRATHSGRISVVPALVGERIQLERVLGRGGVSTVWLGYDMRLGGPVAVKMLAPATLDDPAALQRLDWDARAVAQLAHPNIVTVYEVGVDHGHPYQVLELIEGPSLAALLVQGALPVGRAVDIAQQVCHALAAAHAAGVIHRDLRADNVLLAPDGVVKVGDFGIAHLRYDDTADTRTDMYGLGCLLYAMLVGPQPAGELLDQGLAPLHQRRPDIPPDLVALVGELLASDPADIPASAEQVSWRLSALMGEPTSQPTHSQATTEAGRPRHSLPVTPRRRRLLIVAGVALSVLLAGLTAMLLSGGGADPTAGAPTTSVPPTPDVTTEAIATDEPTPSPTASPSTPRSRRAADLIVALRARLPQLVRDDQLNPEAARELDRRLAEAARAVAAGHNDTALNTVREATDRLVKLRDQNKVTAVGYDILGAAFVQVAAALAAR